MRQNCYLFPLASCLAIAMSSAHAAEPVLLQQSSYTDLQHYFHLLPDRLSHRLSRLATTPIDTLQVVQQHRDKKNITHVRLQQLYAGFPVFGGYAIVHRPQSLSTLDAQKNEVKMNGVVYHFLEKELGQPASQFVDRSKVALQQFKAQYESYSLDEAQVTPMVYIDDQHKAFWAYRVSVFVSHDDGLPERPTAILDAQTLKPFLQWNDVKTLHSPIQGIGFGGNHLTGQYQYGKEFPALTLTRDNVLGICYMENKNVSVVDMLHQSKASHRAMQFHCNHEGYQLATKTYWLGSRGDGYDKANGAYSPSNDALYIGQVINGMYKEWYGLNPLTVQGKPMRLVMRVHFGDHYENAFWDGRQMTFGDGDSLMYPLVSLGVGAHEISHGFTEQHSGLEYVGQSGGMNESFSDMAAQAAEYYSRGANSWAIGADIMKEDSGYLALRFMDEPSRDGRSIDRVEQYVKGMNVHHSSGVYNRFFYLLAHQPQWDTKKAFQVMIKANMDYWTPYSTFEEGACGVISAADDLGYAVADVTYALKQVGMSDVSCHSS